MKKEFKTDGSIKEIIPLKPGKGIARPLYGTRIQAGFPSPAEDYIEAMLDLNDYLIQHPAATFFVRVDGFSMMNAGIFPDDILIVDRSLEPFSNKIVIAVIDGELTVKRLIRENGKRYLIPDNPDYPKIVIEDWMDLTIWGVVTYVIHKV